MLKIGDVHHQIRWIGNVAAVAGGLQIFSNLPSEFGHVYSKLFFRIVVNFRSFTAGIWNIFGDFINVDLSGFENQLTFSCLVAIPYLVFFKRIRSGSFFDEENKLLGSLNFVSFLFISNVFSPAFDGVRPGELSLNSIPIVLFVLCIVLYTHFRYGSFRPRLRYAVLAISLTIFILILFDVMNNINNLMQIPNFITFVLITLLVNSIYSLGLFFRIQGYYPLLTGCIFFFLYYIIDWLLKIAPIINNSLSEMGA